MHLLVIIKIIKKMHGTCIKISKKYQFMILKICTSNLSKTRNRPMYTCLAPYVGSWVCHQNHLKCFMTVIDLCHFCKWWHIHTQYGSCGRKHHENRTLIKFRIPIDKDLGGKDHSYGVIFELDYKYHSYGVIFELDYKDHSYGVIFELDYTDSDELLSLFKKTIR